ncbi:hypothetical protein [Actinokineospora sp. HUAS TT18]|uniref:hypothetical protein n=1 Tax=Actinokineospora sp. HUAS TT18 TaxID=3447451 RepID=UPI003F51FC67
MDGFEVGTSVRAGRIAVVAAVLVALSTVILFASVPRGGRFVLVLAVIVVGGVLFGSADRYGGRLAEVLGRGLVRGIGGGAVFLGCYLSGPLLVNLAARSDAPPSPSQVVLLTFLPPLVALTLLAAKGSRAAAAGFGVVVPTVVAMMLALAEIGPATTALSLLALGIVCAVVAVSSESLPGMTAAAAGPVATAAAIGSGVMPLTALTGPIATPALGSGMQILVTGSGLTLAALFGVLAVLRRDAAGGVLAGSALLVPVAIYEPEAAPMPAAGFVAVPVLLALAVGLALWRPDLAGRVAGWLRPGGATTPAAVAAVGGLALLVFAAQAVPVLGLGLQAQGVAVLVLLVLVTGLAWRLPGAPGAVLAGTTLVAWAVASPWWRLVVGTFDVEDGPYGRLELRTGLGLAVALAVGWLLIRRHRRAGVVVAFAYLLMGQLASLVWTVTHDTGSGAVWAMAVPLVLLGLPAAVIALVKGDPAAQGVAALAVAVGGVTLLKHLLMSYSNTTTSSGLVVLTPTDVGIRPSEPGLALSVAALVLFVVAVLTALSAARRPSAAVLASVLLFVVAGAQVGLAAVLREGGIDAFDTLQWVVLAVTAAATVVAAAVTRSAPLADSPAVQAEHEEAAEH